jgi:hypothetical protein
MDDHHNSSINDQRLGYFYSDPIAIGTFKGSAFSLNDFIRAVKTSTKSCKYCIQQKDVYERGECQKIWDWVRSFHDCAKALNNAVLYDEEETNVLNKGATFCGYYKPSLLGGSRPAYPAKDKRDLSDGLELFD